MSEYSHLVNKLTLANQAYASGNPFMSEDAYHELWRHIYNLNPNEDALYHTSRDPQLGHTTRVHAHKIMGTQKAFETRELKPFRMRFGHRPWVLEPKFDGCACMFYPPPEGHPYKYLAILEGDSLKGRDISHHVPYFTMTDFHGPWMSAELIIPWSHWNPNYGSNPRNTCAGWINSGNKPAQYAGIIHVVPHNQVLYSHYIEMPENLSMEDLDHLLLTKYDEWSQDYPIDGIMVKLADSEDRLKVAHNGTVSLWSIAWKPPIQTAETTVTDIEWNVSRHGKVIPTVVYEPIELCGTVNRRMTGNNYTWIMHNAVGVGARIIVGKAGEIIPKHVRTVTPVKPTIPECCPICNSYLSTCKHDLHLECTSDSCMSKTVQMLEHFYGKYGMDLKSIGVNRIEELLNIEGMFTHLKDHPWALLDPWYHGILNQINIAWGQRRTEIYLDALSEVNGTKTVVNFISALGYPQLGYRNALALYYKYQGYETKSHIQYEAFNSFIRAITALNIATDELPNFSFATVTQPPKLIYAVTGTLSMPRAELEHYLLQYGWHMSKHISKSVGLLILGDTQDKVTAKLRMAQEQGVPIINEDDLPKWLNYYSKETTQNESPEATDQTHSGGGQ